LDTVYEVSPRMYKKPDHRVTAYGNIMGCERMAAQ